MQVNSTPPASAHRHEPNEPPAKAARSALEARTDLQDHPFGRLVSLIAKGEPLPAAPSSPADPS